MTGAAHSNELDVLRAGVEALAAEGEAWGHGVAVDLSRRLRALLAETGRAQTTTEWGVANVDPWSEGRLDIHPHDSQEAARECAKEYGRATVYVVHRQVTEWRGADRG